MPRGLSLGLRPSVKNRSGGSYTPPVFDTTPNAPGFANVIDALVDTLYESNTITVGGLGVAVPWSVGGGSYSKNGGAYTSAASTVQNGDTLTLAVQSDAANSTAKNVTWTMGSSSGTWTVTTEAEATTGGGSDMVTEIHHDQTGFHAGGAPGQWNTTPSTLGATEGAIMVAVGCNTWTFGGLTDSAGGVYTLFAEPNDHGNVTIFGRMVGAAPIVAGETYWSLRTETGSQDMELCALNVPDATSLPTTKTSTDQPASFLNSGANTITFPGPSAAGSIQVVGYRTSNSAPPTIADFGSDDSWIITRTFTQAGAGGEDQGFAVAWRKAGTSTGDVALVVTPATLAYNVLAWGEAAAPDTGASSSSGMSGGGGDGGTISTLGQLLSVLGAGVGTNGGNHYTLDTVDFDHAVLANYNFSANPITFVGSEGTVFQSLSISGCHGLRFENMRIPSMSPTYTAGVRIYSSTDIWMTDVRLVSDDAMGTQSVSYSYDINASSDLHIIGTTKDAAVPDVWGSYTGMRIRFSTDLVIHGLTFDNYGSDCILALDTDYAEVTENLFLSNFGDVEVGEHPDAVQFAYSLGTRPTHLLIQYNGCDRADGFGKQSYFFEDGDYITVRDNWSMAGLENAIGFARCNNCVADNNFLQGFADYGARIIWRGACDSTTVTNNYAQNIVDWDANGVNTNSVVSGNTIIGGTSAGSYAELDAWLADNLQARRRP